MMEMDKLNGWLALAANLGVLLGIIFLAFELQQNTDIARSSAYNETIQELNDWRALVASDPELSLIFQIYIQEDVNSLDEIQIVRLRQLVAISMSVYENAYFSYQRGIMGEAEWLRHERRACEHTERTERIGMDISTIFTDEFNSYLVQVCN